jgi:hypothetical protein
MSDRFFGLLPRRTAGVERLDAALAHAAGGEPIMVRSSDQRR